MKVRTVNGELVEVTVDALRAAAHEAGLAVHPAAAAQHHHTEAAHYAAETHNVMLRAQKELREATGDYPEDLDELYEFAAKHKLFGNREDTHIMCNFMKVFFCLMQKKTHESAE